MFTRISAVVVLLAAAAACSGGTPAPTEAPPAEAPAAEAAPAEAAPAPAADAFQPAASGKVTFVDLAEGAKVKSPLHVKFAVEGLTVKPAGDATPQTGHFHVIVDADIVPEGQVVPADESHHHYGGGQLEADLTLTPGPHKLILAFADGQHRSYGANLSQTVNVIVE